VRFEYAGEKLLGSNISVIEEVDSRSFDPFGKAPTFAEASVGRQGRLCSGQVLRE